jgi:hypothetical protein
MSLRPIARSHDLRRLRDRGYTLRLERGYLIVGDVPYVDSAGVVHHDGALVMALTLAGELTVAPEDHTTYFVGGIPCDTSGSPLTTIINNENAADLGGGLVAACYMSAKPTDGGGRYTDYYHKVTTYVGHIAGPAAALERSATPRRYRPITDDVENGPFHYSDTSSARAGIDALNVQLADERVGIIGQGGSGAYVFDLVAKSHAATIDTFDGDPFLTHNAFRAPGAVSLAELEAQPMKVNYLAAMYAKLRSGIVAHPYRIDESNLAELRDLTFIFLAIDDAPAKAPITAALVELQIPFVDLGMGVELIDGKLTGLVRATLVTPERHGHMNARIPTVEVVHDEDVYRSNIQIAELNALNAIMAVLLWKRYRGVYADTDGPLQTMFSIATNRMVNDERLTESATGQTGHAA